MKMKKSLLVLVAILGLTVFVKAQTVPSYVPTDGLIGWWPFTGNANDASINANDGEVFGAELTTDRYENLNSAYNFDGIDDRIELLYVDFPERTISLWFHPVFYEGSQRIIDTDNPDLENGVSVVTLENSVIASTFGLGAPNNLVHCDFETNTILDWYSVIITRGPDSTRYYYNGYLLCTDENGFLSSTYPPVPYVTRVACTRVLDRFFKGKVDDIGIWDRALTEAEVEDLYNGPTGLDEDLIQEGIQLFPNPTRGEINVQVTMDYLGKDFAIYDQLGKTMLKGKIVELISKIQLDQLPNGVYSFSIGSEHRKSIKVIKH
jgi:concanavalin A-like lectin/glucanase superfamily protein/type IX secretion system substrate protein